MIFIFTLEIWIGDKVEKCSKLAQNIFKIYNHIFALNSISSLLSVLNLDF